MGKRKVNLHISHKRTLLTMVFFSVISIFILLFIGIVIRFDCAQLLSLVNSKYEYSVMTQEPVGQDDFIRYNAGIYYSLKFDSQASLNVDVVMQSDNTHYTENLYWKAGSLNDGEVAVTSGVAKANGLRIGDKLYSKHIVNDSVQGYVIAEIIPDATSVRIAKGRTYSKGIIIMGFDASYFENVSHYNITYTNEAIGNLENYYPEDIVYRDDEIHSVTMQILPYCAVELVILVVLCVVFSIFSTKSVEQNFKRQLMLGFEKESLNTSYMRYICSTGFLSVIISVLVADIIIYLLGIGLLVVLMIVVIALVEILTILLSAFILMKRLWR